MKIYFNPCIEGFTNSYTIVNDAPDSNEVIIVDPGQITTSMVDMIERNKYKVTGVLITHCHEHHVKGLRTLMKIYSPVIYAADSEILGFKTTILNGDGNTRIAGLNIDFFSIPGHSPDSMVYKIEDVLFTGDTLLSGVIGDTSSKYTKQYLCKRIREKLFCLPNTTVILPGHGNPSTIESEKQYNLDIIAR